MSLRKHRFPAVGIAISVLMTSCAEPGQDDNTVASIRMKEEAIPVSPSPLASATPLNLSSADEQYQTYRRELIKRHIAANGRFLQTTALQEIPASLSDPCGIAIAGCQADASSCKDIDVKCQATSQSSPSVPLGNARYSEESSDTSNPDGTAPHLWLPLLAPLKYPGRTNDTRWVLTGDGDNPNYYGGMALAMFSLEALHGVSNCSLKYARKLVEFMLRSEIPASSGYLARRGRFFFTTPIVRGGSAEELLGPMLGLMYYLRAESNDALKKKASDLRDRILGAVAASDADLTNLLKYNHPYFRDVFPVAHFAFPLAAGTGSRLGADDCERIIYDGLSAGGLGTPGGFLNPATYAFKFAAHEVAQKLCPMGIFDAILRNYRFGNNPDCSRLIASATSVVSLVTTGSVKTFADKICPIIGRSGFYDDLSMFPTALLLITQSPNLSDRDKRAFVGPAFDWLSAVRIVDPSVTDNSYLAVLANALVRVPGLTKDAPGQKNYGNPSRSAEYASGLNRLLAPLGMWQHNLPLLKWPALPGYSTTDYNPENRIGADWAWNQRAPHDYVGSFAKDLEGANPGILCPRKLPGWPATNAQSGCIDDYQSVPYDRDFNATDYIGSQAKVYTGERYLEDELSKSDLQVEASGLDFLFPRMLLSEVNPDVVPPDLGQDKDICDYSVLPEDGPDFLPGVSSLEATVDHLVGEWAAPTQRDWTSPEKNTKTVQVTALPPNASSPPYVVTARATSDSTLRLDAWVPPSPSDVWGIWSAFPSQDNMPQNEWSHVGNPAMTGNGFNKVVLVPLGTNSFAAVERAEDHSWWNSDHWLRVSYWQVNDGGASQLAKWDGHHNSSAAQDISAARIDEHTIAVVTKGENSENLLWAFSVGPDGVGQIGSKVGIQDGTANSSIDVAVATANSQHIIYGVTDYAELGKNTNGVMQYSQRFRFDVRDSRANMTQVWQSDSYIGDLMDAAVVAAWPLDPSEPQYLVAIATNRGALSSALNIHSWAVGQDGSLTYKGMFDGETADQYLLMKELNWTGARLVSRDSRSGPWFAIAGYGQIGDTSKGLKLLHGRLLRDGSPTIEGMAVAGDGQDMERSVGIASSPDYGVFSIHKNHYSDDHESQVHLIQWNAKDETRCATCSSLGANCGAIPQRGACDELNCGNECPSQFESCGGGGTPNVCGCTPDCAGKCGVVPSNCGGTVDCGACILYSYFQPDRWDQMDSSTGSEGAAPWVFRGPIARLPDSGEAAPKHEIYRCFADGSGFTYDHMTSVSVSCEGNVYHLEGSLGSVFDTQQPGTVPLGRCYDKPHNDHFSTLSSCSGDGVTYEGVLGYVYPACDGDLMADSNNCGGCGFSCSSNSSCGNGACSCNSGFGNCNGNWSDGCESDLNSNSNCGSCGKQCASCGGCWQGDCRTSSCDGQ